VKATSDGSYTLSAPRYLEHFPVSAFPLNTSYTIRLGGCCNLTGNSFWKRSAQMGAEDHHRDSMALMWTCKRM
jgi:hypothetical protein